ncbi:MAG: alpha/beta hydrolase [Epsilonproteobacteria bacterium]|nr:alpha/beta hydrolase [Campylobacterota bacterium]
MALRSIQHLQHTFDISYEIRNPDAPVDIIILHGWGSNKELMKQSFAPTMDQFRHIYIDLPGFGKSTCPTPLTTADVARIVELLMIHLNAKKEIIVGHSFGGKVALLLDPQVLVLLSSAGIFRAKPLKIKLKIALFKLLKNLGFSKLREMFVADDAKKLSEYMYQTFKNVVDEDYSDEFAKFTNTALICWGEKDSATPLESGKKIASLIPDAKLEVYDGDHYFFMQHAKDIAQKIEQTFLKTLEH